MTVTLYNYQSALDDFHAARRKAIFQEIMARIRGETNNLLSFDEVRHKLKAQEMQERGLRDIPLHAIVGSVNRYEDFTRGFLPRQTITPRRWARVELGVTDPAGLPPIEVYQIGEVYFVKDGNHRVSVARQLNFDIIQAYVTEVRTLVPLTPDIKADDLIIKAEYVNFLEHTRLNEIRPQANLTVTAPGQYEVLKEHIAIHSYFMGLNFKRDIPYTEAVSHWFDTIYIPVVHIVRERGLLRDFPNRTETDLYLWIVNHRAALEKELGWEIRPEAAASHLAEQFSQRLGHRLTRVSEKVKKAIIPITLKAGPPPGHWRKDKQTVRRADRLFSDILVPINGTESGWCALEQGLILAQREEARLHGLHVVSTREQKNSSKAHALRDSFHRQCAEAGISGELGFGTGNVNQKIIERSRWNDLVIINVSYLPSSQPLARISSSVRTPGVHTLIQRCPTPMLAVPSRVSPLRRALLVFDGSPKSEEALFVATYIANRWNIPLAVVSILQEGRVTLETQEYARTYLEEHNVTASFRAESGPVVPVILLTAEEYQSDLIILGGYSRGPLLNVFIEDVVDQLLRRARKPILLCR
jgi:nucleotide-binding universal stress UspA family protein